jgi:hypothetical protein
MLSKELTGREKVFVIHASQDLGSLGRVVHLGRAEA